MAQLVSVIMNCYNSDKYLREAIQSVLDQTYTNWEIIFWDNRSNDSSAAIVKSIADDRIRYFFAPEHTGLGAARNHALGKCTGEFVAFLDCDDIWLPSKLEKQVRIMEDKAQIDLLYANYYMLDMEKNRKKLWLRGKQPEGDIYEKFLDFNNKYSIAILTVLVRKIAFARLKSLFDSNLNLAEDYDLFMRILAGSKAGYLDEPVAIYRVHPNMTSYVLRDGWVNEYKYIAGKFKELGKGETYAEVLNQMEKQIRYVETTVEMANGNLKVARKTIAPYKYAGLRFFLVYLATHMPVRLWFLLRPFWGRGVYIR
jgi:glycosyltransferase involved in cell wall biosynthesis